MSARRPMPPTVSKPAGAAFGLLLAVAILASPAPARADDDVPFDTKILRSLMEGLGLRKDGDGINYQERAPLVIPPGRALPPPERADAAIANNPAWPKDPDVERAKQEAARERSALVFAGDQVLNDQRVLSRAELEKGRTSRTAKSAAGSVWSSDNPHMTPSELGYKGGLFSNMFGRGSDDEMAKFTGEPPRASLTEPPPGYQTPSPDQPYGTGAKASAPKAVDYLTTHVESK